MDRLASGVTFRFNMKNSKYRTNYFAVSNCMKINLQNEGDLNALTGSEHQIRGEKSQIKSTSGEADY